VARGCGTGPTLAAGPVWGRISRVPSPPRTPTIRDVATAAGVSRSTVSRVLNGGDRVSPEAAAAVTEAMRRISYVASHSARSLNTRRSGAVALVVAERQERLFEDPTSSVLVRGLNELLPRHDQTLYITLADDERSQRAVVEQLRSGLLDGIILTAAHADDPIFAMLVEAQLAGAAAVVAALPLGAGRKLPHVTVRDQTASRLLTRHLIDRGRRRIGIIAGPADTSGGRRRLAGFRSAFDKRTTAAGVTSFVTVAKDYSAYEGERAMRELLTRARDLDAVFAASDLLATGALNVLDRAGRAVPGDVALAGFDDSILARQADPPLTTARIPFDRMAVELVRLLHARMDGVHPEPVVLDCELILRAST
jgi:DNA-binding LacI/PurR family transcriptional regulator